MPYLAGCPVNQMTEDNSGDLVWSLSKGFCTSFILLSPSPSLMGRLSYLALFEKTLGKMPLIYLFNFWGHAFLTDLFGIYSSFFNLTTILLGVDHFQQITSILFFLNVLTKLLLCVCAFVFLMMKIDGFWENFKKVKIIVFYHFGN